VTNAADFLHVTQAAISAQIKRLELLLGGPVFDKSGAGLRLTERAGRAGIWPPDAVAQRSTPRLCRTASGPAQLTIGVPPWIASHQLVEVSKLAAMLPEARRWDSIATS